MSLDVRKHTIIGVRWTTFSSLIAAVVQIVQLIILTHFLSPSDFGLMAVVSVVIGFSTLFMDFGISAAIIHKQNITQLQLSSLYWLNVLSGVLLFTIMICIAPYVAAFYNEPKLIELIQILSLTFIMSGVSNQFSVILQKELKFDILSKVQIISIGVSFVVSIFMAVSGFGVYALVYGTLFKVFINSFMNIMKGIKQHKPKFVYQHNEISSMLSFGLFQMGERTVNYINLNVDTLIIGKLLGVEALGIYNVAKTLALRPAQIINPIITKVAFPIMAKVQNDILKLKQIYLKMINYLVSVNFPIYIIIVLTAEPLIELFFGENWYDAIGLLQILAFYGAFRAALNPIGSLQLARGRADLGFYWNFGILLIMPLIVYMGAFYGLHGVAFALVGSSVFLLVFSWHYLLRPLCDAGFFEYFIQIFKPFMIASSAGFMGWLHMQLFEINNKYVETLSVTIVFVVFVFILNRYFNRSFIESVQQLLIQKMK